MEKKTFDTHRFMHKALDGQREVSLMMLADATAAARMEAYREAFLTETGESGMLRLAEIWAELAKPNFPVVLDGSPAQVIADLFALIYAHLIACPLVGPGGISLYSELTYLSEAFLNGEGFE